MPLDNATFVKQEFGNLNLNDKRLNDRGIEAAGMINANPSLSFPNAARGDKAELKAFYRFFQNKNVTNQKVLESHYKNTIQRMLECSGPILLVNDSTYISPAKAKTMKNLKNMGQGKGNGLRVHYMIAIDARTGDVLGITDLRVIEENLGKTNIQLENESDIWKLTAQTTIRRIKDLLPIKDAEKLILVCTYIADREGDDYDLFLCLNKLNLNFIIRSQYDRKINDKNDEGKYKISEFEEEEILKGRPYEIEVQGKDGSKRTAIVQLSALDGYTINPPANQPSEESLAISIVIVREIDSPPGKEGVLWRLLTTHSAKTIQDAVKIVSNYKMRWKIEEINKCAKTGVLIEKRQFTEIDHLLPAISMIFVIAWRILYIRDIGKKDDDTPIEKVFSEEEAAYLNDKLSPEKGNKLTVKEAIRYIAREGGFLGHYDNPGWIILWRGWFKFVLLVEGYTFGKKVKK